MLSVWPWLPLGGVLTTAGCFLLLAEWLASVCRTVKSGRGYWKHTLIGRFFGWLGRNGTYIANNWKEAAANAKYVPKQLPKRAVLWVIGYLFLNTLLINLMVHMRGPVGTAILFLVLLVAFNLYVLARLVKYLRGLDEIIAASGTDTDVTVDGSGLPASLRTLAGNLTVTRETMDKAVEKAVQEERTRTELITNVTHDLKTPLTSLINYSVRAVWRRHPRPVREAEAPHRRPAGSLQSFRRQRATPLYSAEPHRARGPGHRRVRAGNGEERQ